MSRKWLIVVLIMFWTIAKSVRNRCQYCRLFNYLWSENFLDFPSIASLFYFFFIYLSWVSPFPFAFWYNFWSFNIELMFHFWPIYIWLLVIQGQIRDYVWWFMQSLLLVFVSYVICVFTTFASFSFPAVASCGIWFESFFFFSQ